MNACPFNDWHRQHADAAARLGWTLTDNAGFGGTKREDGPIPVVACCAEKWEPELAIAKVRDGGAECARAARKAIKALNPGYYAKHFAR